MQLTTPVTFWLITVLLYIVCVCVSAVIKPPQSGNGRFVWALVIGAALIQLAFDRQNFQTLMKEDGPAEWATFYAFFFAGSSFILRAWQQRSSAGLMQSLILILLGAFCFFVAGEEISWAQRLLGFKPPEVFLEHNFQQETNIHNIFKGKYLSGFSLDSKNLVIMVTLFYGVLFPLLGRLYPRSVQKFSAGVPDLSFTGFFLLVAWAEWAYPLTYSGEAAELYLGCLFFLSQKAPSRRRDHFIMAGVFFLGFSTPPVANRFLYGASEAKAAIAREELTQISTALLQPDVLQKKLFEKSSIHKRIFTAEKAGYFKLDTHNQFLKGRASALYEHGRKDRFGFYLDPWNNPYWIKWRRRKRQLIIYSFGHNRQRDSSFTPEINLQPDDIALTLRVSKKFVRSK